MPTVSELRKQFEPKKANAPIVRRSSVNVCSMMQNQSETRCKRDLCRWDGKQCAPKEYFSSKPYWQVLEEQRQKRLDKIERELKTESNPHKQKDLEHERVELQERSYGPERPWYQFWGGMLPFVKQQLRQFPRSSINVAGRRAYNYLKLHGGASFPTSNVGEQQEYLDRIREIYGALNTTVDDEQAYREGVELIGAAIVSNRLQDLNLDVVALQATWWNAVKLKLTIWVGENLTPASGANVVMHAINTAKSTWEGMCKDHLLENDPFVMEDVEDVVEAASKPEEVKAAIHAGKIAIENGRLDQLKGVADSTNQWSRIKPKLIQHAQTVLRSKKNTLMEEKEALENQENIDPNEIANVKKQLNTLPSPNQAIMALMWIQSTNIQKSKSTWKPDRSDYVTFFVPEAENPFYCIPRKTLVRQSQELNRYLLEPFSVNYEKKMTDENLQLGCIMEFETNKVVPEERGMYNGPVPDMTRPYKVLEIDHNHGTHKETDNDARIRAVHEEKDDEGHVQKRLVLWDNDQNDMVRYDEDDLEGYTYVMYEENQPLFTSYVFNKRSYLMNDSTTTEIGGDGYSHLFIGDAHYTQEIPDKWKIPSVDMYAGKEETQKKLIEMVSGSTSNKMVWPPGSDNQQTEISMVEEVEEQYGIRAGHYIHWGPITGGELREIVDVDQNKITIEGHVDLENEDLRFCKDEVLPKTVVLATSEECTITIRDTKYITDAKQFKLAEVSAYYPKVQGKDNLKEYIQHLIRTNNNIYFKTINDMLVEEAVVGVNLEFINASTVTVKIVEWEQRTFRSGMVLELFEDDLRETFRYVTITNVQQLEDRRYQLTASKPVFSEGTEEVYAYDLEAILTDPVEFWGVVYRMAQQDDLAVEMNFLPCTIFQESFLDTFVMEANMRRKCRTNVAHYLTLDLSGKKVTLDYLHVRKMLDTPDTNAYVITPRVRNKQYYVSNPLWTQTALNGGSLVSARHGEPGDESPIYELRDVVSGSIVADYPSITSHHLNPVLINPSVVLDVDNISSEIGTVSVLQKEVVSIRGTLNGLETLNGKTHSVIYLEDSVAIPTFLKVGDFIQWNGSSKHPVIELTSNTFTIEGEFPELNNWVTFLFANPNVVRKQVNMIEQANAVQWEARDWQTVKRVVNLFGVDLTVPHNLKGKVVYGTYNSEDNNSFTRNMAAFDPLQANAFVNQYGELLEDLTIDGNDSSGVIYGNKMIKDANYYQRAVQAIQEIYREMDEFKRCEPQEEDVMCMGANTVRKNLLQTFEYIMFPFPDMVDQFDKYDKALFTYLICYTSSKSQQTYRELVNLKGADIKDEGLDAAYLVMRFESDKNKYFEDEADADWEGQNEYVNKWFEDRQHLFVDMREVLPLDKQWEWLQRQSMPSSPSSPPRSNSNWGTIGNTPGTSPGTSPLRASLSPIRRMPSFELEESAQGEEGRQGSIFSLDDDDSSDDSSQGLSVFGL
jgi:hypothetical protein